MKNTFLSLSAVLAALTGNTILAVSLTSGVNGTIGSSIQDTPSNTVAADNNIISGPSFGSIGAGGTSAANSGSSSSTRYNFFDDGLSAHFELSSGQFLGNNIARIRNDVTVNFTLNQPTLFSIKGAVNWGPSDVAIEEIDQTALLRLDGISVWREGEWGKTSGAPGSYTLNLVDQGNYPSSSEIHPSLSSHPSAPFSEVSPGWFLVPAGAYQFVWRNHMLDGGRFHPANGGLNVSSQDAEGYVRLSFQRVPEAGASLLLLGIGTAFLGLVARKRN